MAIAKFPPEFLKNIKERVNIVELVGEHVVLRKSGANYTGLCPFHAERSPSFSVSENKQLYHCYGCKKGGDLVSFVMEIYGISFPEAVAELAERARVALPREARDAIAASEDPETQKLRAEAREKRETAYKLNRFAAAFYHHQLSINSTAESYFRTRGVHGELARSFYVGYAPAGWDALAEHLVAKKAPLPLAMELGLIRPSKVQQPAGTGYFDLFRNRAMFPILDMRGKVAGFGGRSLPSLPSKDTEQKSGDEGPKYLNSPESLLFQKSKLVFGLFQAQKHIREKDEIVLVEGYFDVTALHAAGFQNVVATCGTALTPDHLNIFRRFASRVTVLFDGDRAGISATERAMEIGLANGWVLRGASLPQGLDPDEVLFDQQTGLPKPEGREAMEKILGQAHPLLDTRVEEEIRAAETGPEAKTQALKKIGNWLSLFKDPVGREIWSQEIRKRLGVSPQLIAQVSGQNVRSDAPHGSQPQSRPTPPRAVQRPKKPIQLSPADQTLLKGLLFGRNFGGILTEMRAKLPPEASLADFFDDPTCRKLVSHLSILAEPEKMAQIAREALETPDHYPEIREEILNPENPMIHSVIMETLMAAENPLPEGEFRGALERGVARTWARFSQKIKARLADAEAKKDAGLQSQLMKEYLDVQRKMKELTRFYDEA